MRRMNNEIENEVLPNDQTGSQFNDDGTGRNSSGGVLKKGPWTSAEDAILVDYVKKYGEGNWNAVQKHSGLLRCGKSCRLRWANHLRPNLKKGAFTADEERLIAELHAKMGNKWARMAAHLPGRTDNEIKNYWNTRIKRRQRAGLPLYPPEVCMQALQETKHGQSNDGINGGNKLLHDFLQKDSYEMHGAIFDRLKHNQGILPYVPELPDISVYSSMLKGFDSSPYCNFAPSTSPNHKRLRGSTTPFIGPCGMDRNGFYPFDHIRNNTSDKIAQSFGMHSPLEHGPSLHSSICYSHSLSNGNSSTSKPTSEAVKLELPSLQYPEIDLGSWVTSPSPPLLESVDDFIQSPTPISALESDCSSPQNSGLLDALLYQAKTLGSSKNYYSDKSSNSSTATPGDRAVSFTSKMYETDWEDFAGPLSPFGATSVLNQCPAASASANPFIQSPTPISALESDCSSPQNSGLLDALLYQGKTLGSSKNHYSDKSSNSSTATPGDRAVRSTSKMYETDWEDFAGPLSPFGATSVLNQFPAVSTSANSLDEQKTLQSFNGNIVKLESVDHQIWTPNTENQTMSILKITRPDLLLASDWREQGSGHGVMTDDIKILGDGLTIDY